MTMLQLNLAVYRKYLSSQHELIKIGSQTKYQCDLVGVSTNSETNESTVNIYYVNYTLCLIYQGMCILTLKWLKHYDTMHVLLLKMYYVWVYI